MTKETDDNEDFYKLMDSGEFTYYCKYILEKEKIIFGDNKEVIRKITKLIEETKIQNINIRYNKEGEWDGIIKTIVENFHTSRESIDLIKKLLKIGDKLSLLDFANLANKITSHKATRKSKEIVVELKNIFFKEIDFNSLIKEDPSNTRELIYFLQLYLDEDYYDENMISLSFDKIKDQKNLLAEASFICKLSSETSYIYTGKINACNFYLQEEPVFFKIIKKLIHSSESEKKEKLLMFFKNNDINLLLKTKDDLNIIESIDSTVSTHSPINLKIMKYLLKEKNKQEIEALNTSPTNEFNL